mmetsp:Transcript_54972/g.133495  ORF Transcript_54972/g.133495 Transcript_54972/m.133495 type:complete len:100 (-) Transcript_54972:91-390(-)
MGQLCLDDRSRKSPRSKKNLNRTAEADTAVADDVKMLKLTLLWLTTSECIKQEPDEEDATPLAENNRDIIVPDQQPSVHSKSELTPTVKSEFVQQRLEI